MERLEAGAVATQLSGFIRVRRVLDLLDRFEVFIPEPVPNPVAVAIAGPAAAARLLPQRRPAGRPKVAMGG